MPLGLVSYGSSDEESDHEEEKQIAPSPNPDVKSGEISDEEEIIPSVLDDENVGNIPGLSSSKTLFDSLPSASSSNLSTNNFVDENEDLSTIPKAKTYSENPDLKAIKPKKKNGPVKIMAPSLSSKLDDEDDESRRPRIKVEASKVKSGLLGLLPAPKNSVSSVNNATVIKATTSLVPRSVSKKPLPPPKKLLSKKPAQNDSDDEEVPFFTMSNEKLEAPSTSDISVKVKSNPETSHPRIKPGSHPSHQYRVTDADLEYSSVTAPYPPPPPSASSVPGPQRESQEILERLAGKASKRRRGEEEGLNQIIDVNYEDIKPDEREWLTKAMTGDVDKPGPKNTIKGERRRKNQITYLAAAAKEKEHDLKKAWSESAHNRRQAANKYGF